MGCLSSCFRSYVDCPTWWWNSPCAGLWWMDGHGNMWSQAVNLKEAEEKQWSGLNISLWMIKNWLPKKCGHCDHLERSSPTADCWYIVSFESALVSVASSNQTITHKKTQGLASSNRSFRHQFWVFISEMSFNASCFDHLCKNCSQSEEPQ